MKDPAAIRKNNRLHPAALFTILLFGLLLARTIYIDNLYPMALESLEQGMVTFKQLPEEVREIYMGQVYSNLPYEELIATDPEEDQVRMDSWDNWDGEEVRLYEMTINGKEYTLQGPKTFPMVYHRGTLYLSDFVQLDTETLPNATFHTFKF